MKTGIPGAGAQQKFDFPPARPRPFLTDLPARIDSYEQGVASFFQWRTGLNYYATIDQIIDFVINTKRLKVVDFLADTATFALTLAGRKAFLGKIYSFDNNITLLERARQRARHLNLQAVVDFRQFEGTKLPVSDAFAEIAVSIFDFHRHAPEQFLAEAFRILSPEGYLIIAEMIEPKSTWNNLKWTLKKMHLRFLQKNPTEAQGVYYDCDEVIQLLRNTGFRQVIIQGLKPPRSPNQGIFNLIAATK